MRTSLKAIYRTWGIEDTGSGVHTAGMAVSPLEEAGRASAIRQIPPSARGNRWHRGEEGEEQDEEDGWDVLHAVLPPPPSSSVEDVEQYARAVFGDSNRQLVGSPGHGARGLLHQLGNSSHRSGGSASGHHAHPMVSPPQ
jgi:hypothetical protein